MIRDHTCRVVDHDVQPGLRLAPEDFHLGGGSRSWNITDIDPARLEIGPDGVVAAASFVDVDGRRIELDVDDRDGRRRRRSSLLAPVSNDIEVPHSLLVIWMPTFDLVRVTDPPATIRIDGEPVETHRIPLERLHRQRVIKYTNDLLAVEVNREGTRELGAGPGEVIVTTGPTETPSRRSATGDQRPDAAAAPAPALKVAMSAPWVSRMTARAAAATGEDSASSLARSLAAPRWPRGTSWSRTAVAPTSATSTAVRSSDGRPPVSTRRT